MENNENNGLLTKIWGPALWESIHCITYGYPIYPDEIAKKNYKEWLINLGNVLPCKYCRDSYKEFISSGNSKLTDSDLASRKSLTQWGYRIHQRVNQKLGVEYGTTYDDLNKKYESYRAKCITKDNGCTMPINLKADSYRMNELKLAPIKDYSFCKLFTEYAKIRKFMNFSDILNKTVNDMKVSRYSRDKKCWKIIKYMRKNSIDCTENNGKYKGLPTIYELVLLSMLCSNISLCNHSEIINKLKNQNYLSDIPENII